MQSFRKILEVIFEIMTKMLVYDELDLNWVFTLCRYDVHSIIIVKQNFLHVKMSQKKRNMVLNDVDQSNSL